MPLLVSESLEPQIISVATCRALRVKQVGRVYFVESAHISRDPATNKETVDWKPVAVAKGDKARTEAIMWLNEANVKVMATIARDKLPIGQIPLGLLAQLAPPR